MTAHALGEASADEATMIGPFRVLVFRNTMWIAQGIDFDICVQAETRGVLVKRWWEHVAFQIKGDLEDGNEPLAGGWVPKGFHDRFHAAVARRAVLPIGGAK